MPGDLVLLTGATGFIGFRTLVLLVEAGYKVRTAVRNDAGFSKIKSLPSVTAYTSQLESSIVTDITAPGAYDEAVKGVKYVIHVASPFASADLFTADHETAYIHPAVKGTVGMLESASKEKSVERVVITGSILSIMSFSVAGSGMIVDESHRSATSQSPYANWAAAYSASKACALAATKEWQTSHTPHFDVINIFPVFVLGRDETISDAASLPKGSNGLLLGPLLGTPSPMPHPGIPVHVDDLAFMHVKSLDKASIPGNEEYIACSHPLEGIEWATSFDIVKNRFPKECEEGGVFKVESTERPKTGKILVDSTKAENVFGFKFKGFEEQVLSVAEQYLDLVGRK